jgi:branched-chain amino acid transport system ATP-binding protein
LLSVEGVSISFGGLRAIDGVGIDVPPGSIVGLIGPNGAGKTTLFNVVSGLQRAESGTVVFDGTDVTRLPAYQRARLGIGRSFQNLGLVQGENALVNVMAAQHVASDYRGLDVLTRPWRWWRSERRLLRQAIDALALFGLDGGSEAQVSSMSFADARCVELAGVLVRRPRLLLLDEPTTGLDLGEVDQLMTVLRRVRDDGLSMLIVAHDVKFVMDLCDYTYVLAEGRILAQGRPDEVRTDPAVVTAYLGSSA